MLPLEIVQSLLYDLGLNIASLLFLGIPIDNQLEPIHLLEGVLGTKQHIVVSLHPLSMFVGKWRPKNSRWRCQSIQNSNRLHSNLLAVVNVQLGDGLSDLELAVALFLENLVQPQPAAVLYDQFCGGVLAFLDSASQGLEVIDLA